MEGKLKGMLICHALGDALGAPHEFKHSNAYTGTLSHDIKKFNRFTKTWSITPFGSVTDDTLMTFALIDSIIKEKKYDVDETILSYELFANSCGMLGKNTRALFKGVKTVRGYRNRYEKIFSQPMEEWSQSNGSLMRCSPFVIFSSTDDLVKDIKLSNPHSINTECGIIYHYILRHLLIKSELPSIDELIKMAKEKSVLDCLNDVKDKKERDISSKSIKGWVVTALYSSLYCIYHVNDITEAYKYIIEKGGDTDTNAAIMGALFGAKIGYTELHRKQNHNIEILFRVNGLFDNIDDVVSNLATLM